MLNNFIEHWIFKTYTWAEEIEIAVKSLVNFESSMSGLAANFNE